MSLNDLLHATFVAGYDAADTKSHYDGTLAANEYLARLPGATPVTTFTAEEIWLVERMADTVCAQKAGAVAELNTIAVRMRSERALSLDDQIKVAAYDRINTPEVDDFLAAVRNEALHQRERWGVEHDGGKTDAEWFWLVGYLAGKALHNVSGKRLHHIITAAAALLNWHGRATGHYAAPASETRLRRCNACKRTYMGKRGDRCHNNDINNGCDGTLEDPA
jgi:hypothetical protein